MWSQGFDDNSPKWFKTTEAILAVSNEIHDISVISRHAMFAEAWEICAASTEGRRSKGAWPSIYRVKTNSRDCLSNSKRI